MEVRRVSQRALAQRCGVHHSTISRLLTSSRAPSMATALKLATGLRVTHGDEIAWLRRIAAMAPARDRPADVLAALAADPMLSPAQVALVHDYYMEVRAAATPARRGNDRGGARTRPGA